MLFYSILLYAFFCSVELLCYSAANAAWIITFLFLFIIMIIIRIIIIIIIIKKKKKFKKGVFFLRRLTSFTHQPTTTARKVNSYRQWGINYLVHSQRRTYSNLSDNYSRVLIAQATSIDAFHNIRGTTLIEITKNSIVKCREIYRK